MPYYSAVPDSLFGVPDSLDNSFLTGNPFKIVVKTTRDFRTLASMWFEFFQTTRLPDQYNKSFFLFDTHKFESKQN